MKKITWLCNLGLSLIIISCSNDSTNSIEEMEEVIVTPARTVIPDTAFESAIIELNIDDVADGSVLTENIKNVTSLVMNDKGISSLSGIDDFLKLDNLWVNNNTLTTLDVSKNPLLKFVFAENNQLTSVTVTNLNVLEKLEISNNEISSLNLTDNSLLQVLGLKNNALSSLDISPINNSIQLNTFSIENNPLSCIKVNAEILSNIRPQWTTDEADTFALDCN